jgi:hypothetical protein
MKNATFRVMRYADEDFNKRDSELSRLFPCASHPQKSAHLRHFWHVKITKIEVNIAE